MKLEELRAEVRRIKADHQWANERIAELERGFVEYCRLVTWMGSQNVGRYALSLLETTVVHVHAQNTLGECGGPYPDILEKHLSADAIRSAHDVRAMADKELDEIELMRLQGAVKKAWDR